MRGTMISNPGTLDYVYAGGRREQVAELVDLRPPQIAPGEIDERLDELADVEVVFSTWGMAKLNSEQLDRLPNLKAVFYAAGSVQSFARPFLERGIVVASSWAANAVPVAEFTVAQILLSMKRYFYNSRQCTSPDGYLMKHEPGFKRDVPGVFGDTVALLGAGMIGRKVIELLRPFHLNVIVFDPYLADAKAKEWGVEKVSLEEAFARGFVVSNHVANLPSTRGMIAGEHFASMRQGATFINTGRGATVVEEDLVQVFRDRTDLEALLDVYEPAVPVADSPLYTLPNIHLSSHIAGSMGMEVIRMADYAIQAFKDWRDGKPLDYAVTLDMLEWMA